MDAVGQRIGGDPIGHPAAVQAAPARPGRACGNRRGRGSRRRGRAPRRPRRARRRPAVRAGHRPRPRRGTGSRPGPSGPRSRRPPAAASDRTGPAPGASPGRRGIPRRAPARRERHMGVDGGRDDDHLGRRGGVGLEQAREVAVPDVAGLRGRLGDVDDADQLGSPGSGQALQVLQVDPSIPAGPDEGTPDRALARHRCAPAGSPSAGGPAQFDAHGLADVDRLPGLQGDVAADADGDGPQPVDMVRGAAQLVSRRGRRRCRGA